ncbi:Uncharacterized protein GBIM_15437, partial [Gryllus bimaculatus]
MIVRNENQQCIDKKYSRHLLLNGLPLALMLKGSHEFARNVVEGSVAFSLNERAGCLSSSRATLSVVNTDWEFAFAAAPPCAATGACAQPVSARSSGAPSGSCLAPPAQPCASRAGPSTWSSWWTSRAPGTSPAAPAALLRPASERRLCVCVCVCVCLTVPFLCCRSTSKASYIAYRRERDRGLPNFEGSYKRTMSPSERPEVLVDTPASSPVPECDRLSVGESSSAASLEEKDFRASALHACSNACSNACSDKTPPGIKEEPPIVMERLDLLPAPAGRTSPRSPPRVLGREASPDVVPALALALALAPAPAPSPAPPPRVESETQCDLTEDKGGPSPAPDSPPRSPAPAPAHAHATAAPSPKVQVTECLQLVQRSEVVLRVNAATSDAASQTEVEQEADAPAPTPPASPT